MASRQGLAEGLPSDQKVARTHELGVGFAILISLMIIPDVDYIIISDLG